ncbi:uncharacterized protein LOC119571289 [Penaeus monodon]|uniref:uncharacterized protein LOC119571289 n=1 Tax=Penaeus monodon TaxID=6687 RepID=UPI0018A785C2|nr:uncharacterized protein LOC119571289 [Penaeus monodon]
MNNITKDTPQIIIQKQFQELININYKDFNRIFTDGSKINEPDSTSAAIYIQNKNITTIWKLPPKIEITHAELFAIKQGLKYVINNKLTKTIILTDSQSSLQLIKNPKPLNYKQITYEIQKQIHFRTTRKQEIKIQWIPSHKNIKGNEIVDLAAKKAHEINNPMSIPPDPNYIIKETKKKNNKQWESNLKRILSTKNYLIKDNSEKPWTRAKYRKLDTCITRLITKHTRLKQHLYRMKMDNDPFCRWCKNQEETIEHMLLYCPRFNSHRTNLKDALRRVKINDIDINLLITGADQPSKIKYYILRHTKIFLQTTKLSEII